MVDRFVFQTGDLVIFKPPLNGDTSRELTGDHAVNEDTGGSEDVGDGCAGEVCDVTGQGTVAFCELGGRFFRLGADTGSEVIRSIGSCCYTQVTHVSNNRVA